MMIQWLSFEERIKRKNEFDASLVYGTKEFNILTQRDRHIEDRQNNDDYWLDSSSGFVREECTIHRKCPLCGSVSYELIFVKSGFKHVRCLDCTLVYVPRILNEKEYEKLYEEEDSWGVVLENEHQKKLQSLEGAYSLDVASLYADQAQLNICDIGCGPGRLLHIAKERGNHVLGIEPNKRYNQSLDELGIPYINDFFPLNLDNYQSFDIIFTLNTLEHLPDPKGAIEDISKILKPKGLVYISVPNIDALVTRVLKYRSGVFGGHSHIQFFNAVTLSQLVKECGFEVLEYETIITELGVLWNDLNFQHPYLGDSKDNLGFLTPEMIYRNHLARNVNLVARKVN